MTIHRTQGGVRRLARQDHPSSQVDIPVIDLPTEIRPDVTEWHLALAAEKAATEKRREVEARLAANVEPLWRERCCQDGRVHQHVTLNGADAGTISMVHHSRFKRTSDDDEERLRGIFGEKDYEMYFDRKCLLSIDAEKLTEEQADRMKRALGNDVVDLLRLDMRVVPRNSYWRDRVLRRDIQDKVMKAEAEGLALFFAPSFRA